MATAATTVLMTDLPSGMPSPPLIARSALLAKGRNAFARVFADPGLALQVRLERELGLQVVRLADARRLLDQPIGHRRPGREAARIGGDLIAEHRLVEHLVDQPHAL